MELNCKRKLDCLADSMDVVVADGPGFSFYTSSEREKEREAKKLKICLNARVEPMAVGGEFTAPAGGVCPWEDRGCGADGGFDFEEDGDIPSTSEVIHSLRKVMLWMSAQEDRAPDQLQFLTDVERYALSKVDPFTQQRKITEFFKQGH